MKSKILIVGGAGYIGSHMVLRLAQAGYEVVVFDNLSNGHRDAVLAGDLVIGDLADRAALASLFTDHRFDAVMHFASSIQVGESMQLPARYYANNVGNTIHLIETMIEHGVQHLIFSSSAAIFGDPVHIPINESHPRQPITPYGWSKWMVEQILTDCDRAHGLRYVALRYFNAAGAQPEGLLGERHEPETHLIPLILQAASGRRAHISVFGTDYNTPDGTCIRDYIHVQDLADAHLLALDWLMQGKGSSAFNLGNGSGFSIREVIGSVEEVTGQRVAVQALPRRSGDPAVLVADSTYARAALGWQPQYTNLYEIVQHAWRWENKCPPPL
ncbi:UDP-glucose 4-epimerase GalE [Azovibrio restrictus]|uniref:UDP-glucose 4-epimerase GalE n=1 Tax=Azovibrio restrictus TaxID=146938 RepID=UPI00040F6A3C|nr:UDP-glucose 4-epimerase GalE [Azovibrio restrictus]